jgi:hypothetical protein
MSANLRFVPQSWARLLAALLISGLSVASLARGQTPPSPAVEGNGPLPPAKEILARFVKEIGGRAAVEEIKSQHITGKVDMGGQGITGPLEVFAKRPDKILVKINLPGIGEMLQGFDGKVGWGVNAVTGPMLLEGKMLEQLREQSVFDSVLHEDQEFKSMETVGKTQFEGKECYQLKLVRHSGQEVTEFYDVQSGLLMGSSQVQETPLGAIAVTGVVGDYRKFGAVLFATRMTQKIGPLAQVMTFERMEFNRVDDSVFDLPASIKALTQ